MSRRVLVVQDDALLRRLYATAYRIAGFEISEAADGVSALQTIQSTPPVLIVLDLWLPTLSGHAIRQANVGSALGLRRSTACRASSKPATG